MAVIYTSPGGRSHRCLGLSALVADHERIPGVRIVEGMGRVRFVTPRMRVVGER